MKSPHIWCQKCCELHRKRNCLFSALGGPERKWVGWSVVKGGGWRWNLGGNQNQETEIMGKNLDSAWTAVAGQRNIKAEKVHALGYDFSCHMQNGLIEAKMKAGDHSEFLQWCKWEAAVLNLMQV